LISVLTEFVCGEVLIPVVSSLPIGHPEFVVEVESVTGIAIGNGNKPPPLPGRGKGTWILTQRPRLVGCGLCVVERAMNPLASGFF